MRNLGGRSNVSRQANRVRVPPRKSAGSVGGIDTASYVPDTPVTLTESFDKGSSAGIGPDLTWTSYGAINDFVTVSNQLTIVDLGPTLTSAAAAYAQTAPWPGQSEGGLKGDMTVSVDYVSSTTNPTRASTVGLVGRKNPGTSGWAEYLFQCHCVTSSLSVTSFSYDLYYLTSTFIATLLAGPTIGPNPTGKRIEFSVIGSSLVGKVDGSTVISVTNTLQPNTPGDIYFGGIALSSDATVLPTVDNWAVSGVIPGHTP